MTLAPRYPHSFTLLLLLAFLLVVLPLIAGLYNTATILGRLAREAHNSIAATVAVTRTARQLADGVDVLQRTEVQSYVLQDPSLRRAVTEAHQNLRASISTLEKEPFTPAQLGKLAAFAGAEGDLYAELGQLQGADQDRLVKLAPRFDSLHAMALEIVAEANQVTDRQAAVLQETATSAQRSVLLQAVSIVPLSLFLALVFSWMISRPVRQIGRAVERLGRHDLTPHGTVRGPRDLVKLGEQIDWLRQRLIELEERQALFLRHVSHELKTPLATLREGVELLADKVGGELTAQQEEIIVIMRGNAVDLQRMIEDLITFSQVYRQPEPVVPRAFPLPPLFDELLAKQHLVIRAKSVRVDLQVDGVDLIGDRAKLAVVFGNLLNNAIRFSPEDGHIRIRAISLGRQSTISICDEGPGIPEHERPFVFDPFFKGRVQPADTVRGTGLGLALARQYAEAHEGKLMLVDDPPWSTCFQVVLPTAGKEEV